MVNNYASMNQRLTARFIRWGKREYVIYTDSIDFKMTRFFFTGLLIFFVAGFDPALSQQAPMGWPIPGLA